MKDNIFNKIINNKTKTKIIYKDKYVTAFNDINPKCPIHIIIIPNIYIKNLNYINNSNILILGKMLIIASKLAKKNNINKSGYRLIFNCNKNSGQEIDYLHLHLLGGCNLGKMINLKK